MNKKLKNLQLSTIITTITSIILIVIILCVYITDKNQENNYYFYLYASLLAFAILTLVQFALIVQAINSILKQKKISDLKGSSILGADLEEAYNFGEVGLIVVDDQLNVIWVSEYLENHNFNLLDRKIDEFNSQLLPLYENDDEDQTIKIEYDNRTFEVKCIKQASLFIFKDISSEEKVRVYNEEHVPVVGFVNLDNYSDIVQSKEEGVQFELLGEIRKSVYSFFERFNTIVRQIRNDLFIFITTRKAYEQFFNERFNILETIRNLSTDNYTISVGVGIGIPEYDKLTQLASDAIDVALSRGGDQVVIAPYSQSMIFLGGKSEAKASQNKVKMRVKIDSLVTVIEHSENVFVMGHKISDFDAIGACMGIKCICDSLSKPCKIYRTFNDLFEQNVRTAIRSNILKDEIKTDLFIQDKDLPSYIKEDTLVVIVDCNSPNMVINPSIINGNTKIAIIDHHRPDDSKFSNVLFETIDSTASSTCELLTNYMSAATNKINIPSYYATYMITGILLDTDRYRMHTSPLTFDASSILIQAGADLTQADNWLKIDFKEFSLKTKLLNEFETFDKFPGVLYCEERKEVLVPKMIAIVAQSGMEISGTNMTIVVAKTEKTIKISARSDGTINCQLLLSKLGGGGHFRAAAADFPLTTTFEDIHNRLIKVFNDYYYEAKREDTPNQHSEME